MNRAYDCTVRDAAAEVRTNSNMGFCARYQDTLSEFPILYVLWCGISRSGVQSTKTRYVVCLVKNADHVAIVCICRPHVKACM